MASDDAPPSSAERRIPARLSEEPSERTLPYAVSVSSHGSAGRFRTIANFVARVTYPA